MRVLYDISTLGLGHLYAQSRGGSFRVHQHLAEGLAASGECELLFCANHSSVAYHGCVEYLRTNPRLGHLPLLGPRSTEAASRLRRGVAGAHRWTRALLRSNVLPRLLRHGGRLVDRRLHPPVADASPPADVFHSPGTPLPPRPRGRSPRRLLTVYDLVHVRFPDVYGPAYSQTAQSLLDSVRDGDWVITTSESTRAELCERGVAPPGRVCVVPLAADREIFHPCADPVRVRAVREKYGIPDGPYLLSVNPLDPRKNMHHAVRAFARLAEEARDLSFVLVGHAGAGSRHVQEALEEVGGVRGRVILTGYAEDEELAPLYSGATAFVYPSLYEGFGLPPLEAMQCGTPVITSNTSSLPEVVGDAGLMVDPGDIDALCEAMLKVYRDAALRERMRAKSLARAAEFSWERCTEQTLAAYRAALAA
ncbi:MAG TPA: glycosyltransferase family 1 protein [Longimicrobium sp.]|jgi:glycosyltransferase involved in cell wall biosynthesis